MDSGSAPHGDLQWIKRQFAGFSALTVLSIFAAAATELYWLAGIPVLALMVFWTLVDFRKIFYLLLFCIPLSVEFYFDNGLATDLPTEPLMLGLMGIYVLYLMRHNQELSSGFLRHPITILLLLHLSWILFAAMFSQDFLVSIKFFLAKIWYIAVFFFLAGLLLKRSVHFRSVFWAIYVPLTAIIIQTMIRHASYGFTFSDIGWCVTPFFRNHVNYASILTLFFPFLWLALGWYRRGSFAWWVIVLSMLLYLAAIQLSFTRAAYASLLAAAGVYFLVRWRLMQWVVAGSLIVAVFFISNLVIDSKYLDYAPNFERTISHQSFDNLIEATYKGEDISTMERVYRWVAGYGMLQAKPWLGFGPGNFYGFYKNYTVTSFRTYVSDNPEQSGIHNYFLMTLVEQGIPGLLIFLALIILVLLRGQKIYNSIRDPGYKRIAMAAYLSFVVIACLLIINDMVETDKVGTFFFMNMAILINMELWHRRVENPWISTDPGTFS